MKIIKELSYNEMKLTLEKRVNEGHLIEIYKKLPEYGNVNNHEIFVFKDSKMILDELKSKYFIYQHFSEVLIVSNVGFEEFKKKPGNNNSPSSLRDFCYSKFRKSNKTFKEI